MTQCKLFVGYIVIVGESVEDIDGKLEMAKETSFGITWLLYK